MRSRLLLGFLALGLGLSAAQAATIVTVGAGGAIPDCTGGITTCTPGVFTSDVVVAAPGSITDVTVSIDVAHTFIGDLIVTLENVGTGDSAVLFSRVGLFSPSTCCGDGADLSGAYSFNDSFAGDFWAASTLAGSGTVPAGDYFPTTADNGASSLLAAVISPFCGLPAELSAS